MAEFFIQTSLGSKFQNYDIEKTDLPDWSRQDLISCSSGIDLVLVKGTHHRMVGIIHTLKQFSDEISNQTSVPITS